MDPQAVVQHADLGWHGVGFRMADRHLAWHSCCRLCRFAFGPERLWNNVLPKPCAVVHHVVIFIRGDINRLLHKIKRSHRRRAAERPDDRACDALGGRSASKTTQMVQLKQITPVIILHAILAKWMHGFRL
jgi:hypothetical protein